MMQGSDEDSTLDDDLYDDILDDSFEDDIEEDFVDAEYEDLGLDGDDDDLPEDDYDPSWDDDGDDENDVLAAGQQKEKVGFNLGFNTMAVVGALILGCSVLVYQVITNKPEIVSRFTSALRMGGSADGLVFEKNPEEKNSLAKNNSENDTKGFLHNPDMLDGMGADLDEMPPSPVPITSNGNKIEEAFLKVQNLTETAKEKVPRPPRDVVSFEEEENAQQNVSLQQDEANKAEEALQAALNARQEERAQAQKRAAQEAVLAEKEKRILEEKQKKAQEAVQSIRTAGNVDDTALKQRLSVILGRLDDMELQIAQIREAGNSKIENMGGAVDALKKEMSALEASRPVTPANVKTKRKPKAEPFLNKTPVKTKKKIVKKAPAKKNLSRVSWELRAAQPGKAWVSRKGKRETHPVVVGDELSGIGRVKSISYVGGRWIVQGTRGRISQ